MTTSSGTHQFLLSGPSSADFDLYLYKKRGRNYRTQDSSTNSGSSESISYSGSSGDYIIQVTNYAGSGSYSLCYSVPN